MIINSKTQKGSTGGGIIKAVGANSVDTEKELRKLTHDLIERVKELGCLYGISRLLSL